MASATQTTSPEDASEPSGPPWHLNYSKVKHLLIKERSEGSQVKSTSIAWIKKVSGYPSIPKEELSCLCVISISSHRDTANHPHLPGYECDFPSLPFTSLRAWAAPKPSLQSCTKHQSPQHIDPARLSCQPGARPNWR